ncbi:MAG: hypothetical protein JJT76_08875 [Clostridiaceae bacterium]|nr:hypothetical protein [Clostridiaceae bacterium]
MTVEGKRGWFHKDTTLLFFFLLLVIIFCNCGIFGVANADSLLFFFLLLVLLFGGRSFWC